MTARNPYNFLKQAMLAALLYLALVGLILILGFADNKVNRLEFREQTYHQIFGVNPQLPRVTNPKESRRPRSQPNTPSVPKTQPRAPAAPQTPSARHSEAPQEALRGQIF